MFLNCTLKYNMFFLFTDCIKMLCSFMEKPNKWHWIKIILRISILKFKKKQPIYLCCINVYMDNDVFFLYTLMKKTIFLMMFVLEISTSVINMYLHLNFFCLISFFNSYIFCEFWWTKYVLPLLVTYTSDIINTLFLQ